MNEAERIGIAALREKLAKEIADARDCMVAEGEDIIWLFCQLVHWPHERVHPERTMSDPFIRVSAARTALALLERIEKLEARLRECADELEAEIEARRPNELPRRIERDLDTVRNARRILSETPHAE